MSASRNEKLGLYTALQIANGYGLGVHELLAALGGDVYSLRMTSCDPSLQRNLKRLYEILQRLRRFFGDDMDAVREWLRAPRPQHDGATPLELLEQRKITSIESLISAVERVVP